MAKKFTKLVMGGGNVDLTDATAIASEIFKDKTAYIADGKVTGTFTIDNELTEQTDLIAQISELVATKATPQGGTDTSDATAATGDILSGKTAYVKGEKVTGTIATKTSSNLTASGATVTVPAGYYASNATKSISSGSATTPATTVTKNPTISINSSGKITASVSGTQSVTPTVTAGYISSGTAGTITVSGSATKQLTTQAAKTITPTTSSQTAVASGVYTTGAVTVAAIPSNYEDVATETSAYTTKIASLETAIAALETELEGKASGGGSGGGGGGSIETCTVSFTLSGIESDSIESELNKIIAYTNGNSEVVSQTMREFDVMLGINCEISGSVTVKVGTLLYFAPLALYTDGECTKLDNFSIIVNGDCNLMY